MGASAAFTAAMIWRPQALQSQARGGEAPKQLLAGQHGRFRAPGLSRAHARLAFPSIRTRLRASSAHAAAIDAVGDVVASPPYTQAFYGLETSVEETANYIDAHTLSHTVEATRLGMMIIVLFNIAKEASADSGPQQWQGLLLLSASIVGSSLSVLVSCLMPGGAAFDVRLVGGTVTLCFVAGNAILMASGTQLRNNLK